MYLTDYLECVFDVDKYSETIDKAAEFLTEWEKNNPFCAIAFTGVSGAALAFPLSARLHKPLLCVRKNINSHSMYKVEGYTKAKRYIIVDDFVCSGDTVKYIRKSVENEIRQIKLAGIYLYKKECSSGCFKDLVIN